MRQAGNTGSFLGGTVRFLSLAELQVQRRGKEANNESHSERCPAHGRAGKAVAAAQRQVPVEGPGSGWSLQRDGAAPGVNRTGILSRGLAAAPAAPRAAAVEAELRPLPAEGRGDRADPGGLPVAGQPRGRRGRRDFVGLYCKRRKAEANFAAGKASGSGSPDRRRSIPGSPERSWPPSQRGRGPRVRPQLGWARKKRPCRPQRGADTFRRPLGQRQLPPPASL